MYCVSWENGWCCTSLWLCSVECQNLICVVMNYSFCCKLCGLCRIHFSNGTPQTVKFKTSIFLRFCKNILICLLGSFHWFGILLFTKSELLALALWLHHCLSKLPFVDTVSPFVVCLRDLLELPRLTWPFVQDYCSINTRFFWNLNSVD